MIGVAILSLDAFLWFAGSSPSFRHCVQQTATELDTYDIHASPGSHSFFGTIGTYRDCAAQFVRKDNGAITALATLLLTFVTAILVWMAFQQNRTTRAQLRAYVMVGTADTADIAFDRMPKGKIQIKNFGQTPAHNVCASIAMGFAEWPFQDLEWPVFDAHPVNRSERPLAPGDDFSLHIDLGRALSREQVAAIYGGRWALWIAGKVFYKDAFGQPRETDFCFFTTKITGVGALAAVEGKNRSI
jgi:hypothetical protein